MQNKTTRATILVAIAAAFGVPIAACSNDPPAKPPILATEVPASATSETSATAGSGTSPMPSGSMVDGSCSGAAGHSCSAMKKKTPSP